MYLHVVVNTVCFNHCSHFRTNLFVQQPTARYVRVERGIRAYLAQLKGTFPTSPVIVILEHFR